jgi:hypothetical protein
MSHPNDKSIAESCGRCGLENREHLPICPHCGSSLSSGQSPADTKPKAKSKAVAICLALIFGPLGLLYVGAWMTAAVAIMVGSPFVFLRRGGLWLTFVSRIICASLAYRAVVEQDNASTVRRDTSRLLEAAARLESHDRAKAVAAYEEIVKSYPDTPASREAARNIQTLRRQA